MKEFFARLNSTERRFVVGVALLAFLVINIFWVWPHFSDWSSTRKRMEDARYELQKRETAIREGKTIEASTTNMVPGTQDVPPEDQAFQFVRIINMQAAQSGLNFTGNPRQTTKTNDPFFVEQIQTINVAGDEKQLVDFLYNLGAGNSMIRVRDLSVQPDNPQTRQRLNAHVTLVASYQKKAPVRPAAPAPKPATPPAPKPAAPPAPSTAKPVPPKPTPAKSGPTNPAAGPPGSKPPPTPPAVTKPATPKK